jgi:UDP-N-acetylmuramoyl-tripeptide--D-alanyl-D-alanine ligase
MKTEQLHKLFLASTGVSTDTRKITIGNIFFALTGETFNGNLFAEKAIELGASYAIIDDENFLKPNNKTILVENVLETLQDLAKFHRKHLNIPIIALTGSNGKTTSKELICAVLKQKLKAVATQGNLNNHIGVPLTLLSMNKNTEIGIVEMGANHHGEIAALCEIAQPDFGYITNFGKAHIEGFGSLEGVIQAKTELYEHLRKNNKMVFINTDDHMQIEKSKGIHSFTFGIKNSGSRVEVELAVANPFLKLTYNNIEINTNIIGIYNFSNLAAAIAIGTYFDVSPEVIKNGIESYTPGNNRSQIIKLGNNTILMDAYNANPTSMRAALDNFNVIEAKHKIAILGDMFELGEDAKTEHQNIAEFAELLNLNYVLLVGKNFFKTKTENAKKFETFEDLRAFLEIAHFENFHILIKGSRGMALERALDSI